jgi:hypothetical protein
VTRPIDHGPEIRCYMRDPDRYLIEVGQAAGCSKADSPRSGPKIRQLLSACYGSPTGARARAGAGVLRAARIGDPSGCVPLPCVGLRLNPRVASWRELVLREPVHQGAAVRPPPRLAEGQELAEVSRLDDAPTVGDHSRPRVLIGYLANLLPTPGGFGVLKGGLAGTLIATAAGFAGHGGSCRLQRERVLDPQPPAVSSATRCCSATRQIPRRPTGKAACNRQASCSGMHDSGYGHGGLFVAGALLSFRARWVF